MIFSEQTIFLMCLIHEGRIVSIESSLTDNDMSMVIAVKGRFDFSVANDFRNCYRNDPVKNQYIIDLKDTNFMDSAAVGMILLLHEFTENKSHIRLQNCNTAIKKIVVLSHIDRFVEIAA